MTKLLLTLLTMVLLAIGAVACGSTSDNGSSTSKPSAASTAATDSTSKVLTIPKAKAPLKAPSRPGIDDTYDEDDTASRGTEEHDDREIEIYGTPASPAEWQSAIAFAKSYFAAGAAEDGAKACTLLTPSLAAGIGGNYERPGEPVYLHGKTCAEVMTKLFKHRHKLMTAEAAGLEVTDVRVTAQTVFILLAFKGIRERRFMGVERTSAGLKLEGLTDSQYP